MYMTDILGIEMVFWGLDNENWFLANYSWNTFGKMNKRANMLFVCLFLQSEGWTDHDENNYHD